MSSVNCEMEKFSWVSTYQATTKGTKTNFHYFCVSSHPNIELQDLVHLGVGIIKIINA